MEIKKLQAVVIDALEDIKAQDIKLFDTSHLTSLFDRIVIVSGTSNRQTKALAASVRDKVKEAGGNVVGIEGEDTGEWVLVDLGDMLVHIMQAPIRAYYRLEEIWGDKEIKLGAAKRLVKKTEADPAAPVKKTSRHLASMQTPVEAEPAIETAPKRKAAAKKDDAAPVKRSRSKKVEAAAVIDTIEPAKKPRTRKAAVVEDAVEEAPAKAPRTRKPAEPKVATGKTVKVAPTKTTVAELKEIKEEKARARKREVEQAAAPVKRVMKRATKAKDE